MQVDPSNCCDNQTISSCIHLVYLSSLLEIQSYLSSTLALFQRKNWNEMFDTNSKSKQVRSESLFHKNQAGSNIHLSGMFVLFQRVSFSLIDIIENLYLQILVSDHLAFLKTELHETSC
jgi:hypothetical protein